MDCTTLTSTAFWFYGCEKLTDISGIGNLKTDNVTNMSWMFGNCSCLTSLDISGFNTANVTDMGSMFFGCSDLTSLDLSSFNTGNVTSMQSMFLGCTGLTSLDVSNFKTYNVTNMSWMFLDCTGLTSLDLSSFNTSNVKYDANIYNYGIQSMFEGCSALTTIWVGDNWTTANLTESVDVFKDCAALVGGAGTHFDPNHVDYTYAHIDGGTSNPGYFTDKNASLTIEPYAVLTTDTTSVLSSDSTGVTYGQTLTFYYDNKKTERNGMSVGPFTETYDSGQERWNIDSGWDEKRENITTVVFDDSFANCTTLTSTAYWFYKCNKLTAISGIEYLKTDNVTNMRRMFDGCSGLTNLDVSNFKTDNVTNMSDMFFGCSGLTNLDVSNFKTDNVTDMSWLFSGCTGLTNLDVSNFKTDNVTNMSWLFSGCTGLTNLDVSNFKTDNVTDMNSMFYGCSGLTSLDVSNFKTNNVTNMSDMFYDCSGLTNLDVSGFKTDNVTDMNSMFYGCSGLTSLDVSNFKTDNVTNMSAMFFGCSGLTNLDVSNFNTANVTDMGYMFSLCFGLTTLDVSHFNTANVTDMGSMFSLCFGLTTLDVSHFNTANVTDMGSMFGNCSSLTTLDVSNFKTDSVTDMSYMFLDCSGLTNLDVSNFKTDNVTNMSWMFDGCSGLTALDVSSFNTDNVTNMIGMFYGCSGLTSLDVSVFNTANVTDMGSMFRGCSSLTTLDVSNFNTDNVTNMGYMFNGCSSLTTIYIGNGWSTEAVTNGGNMFTGCTNLVGGASTAYDSNHVDHTYAHIDGGTSNPGYFTAKNQETDNKFSTCAEVGAGEDGKTYRVKGRVKSISNTTFGNWYIEDATDSLYIYGTVDYVGRYPRDGMSWESYGINVGDTVTVQGPKSTYKGVPELVDVRVLSPITLLNVSSNDTAMIAMINRESIRLAPNAATVTAKLYYAGSNCEVTIPDHAQSWLTLQSIEANNGDAEAIFSISDNITTGKRGAEVLFKTSNDSIVYETALFISQNDLELSPYAVLTTDSTSVLSNDSTGVTYGKTLTFYYDDQKEVRGGMSVGPFTNETARGWSSYVQDITTCTTLTSTAFWFYGCEKLTDISGIGNLKTDNVTNMYTMFYGCSGLTNLDVSNFKTDNVTDMSFMFSGCSGLTSLDVSNFKKDNVRYMKSMFSGCSGLTNLDVSNFKTDNVTDMSWMFLGCTGLTSLDLSSFNTSNVKYDANIYNYGIQSMFEGCSALTTIWVGDNWTTANLTESVDVFKDCAALVGGAGTHFDPDHVDYTYAHIDGGVDNPGYLTSIADTAAVAPVTFARENNELTLLCETPNTTIWYAVNQNVTDTLDVKSVTIAEFNAAEVSNDVWYRLTGTVHNLKDDDRYGNFNLQDETDSVYVYGLLSEKGGEKKKFQELVAEKGITNGSTIAIIGHRGEYNGKVEVVNAYYDNGEGDWQQYTAPLALDSDCTVKAYAARPSGIRSAISSYVFKKTDRPKVETPTFAWENDKLLISSATEDATIYYSVKEFTTEPTGDGTLASPYNVAAALQYINTLEGDSPSSDSIFVKGVVSDIKDVSTQYGNATFYITDIGKTGGNYLYAYRVKDVGNQNISSEDAVKLGDEVIIRGLVVKYRGVTPETVQGAAYIYAYTTPEMNTLYESPIAVSDNVIVRAKATKQDMSDSEMAMLSVSSEPYALLSENNTKLTFYYDKLKDAKGGMGVGPFIQSYNTETGSYYLQGREWEDHAGDITTVEFDPSFGNCTTITNMVGWFFENTKLQTINGLEYLNTSNVTNMLALFNGCTSLTSLDLSTFDTHNVTNMRGMFYGCTSLTTLNVSSFNTSNVLGFNSMFNNCTSLKSIDVSRFDTKNATSLRMMFLNCHSLEALDITNFETSNVTDMYYVFGGLQLPSIDLSKMNTEKVETMEGLFSHTAFTSLDLSSFNTSQVKNMYSMFANSSNLQTIYVGDGWSTESIVITDSTSYGSRLFYGCEKLVGGKGTVYDASHIDVTYAHIDGGTSNPGYFTDKNAPVIEATFDGRVLAVGGSTTMTDALESVGGRNEVAKTITAIVWNSSATLTNSDLQGLDNPNLLIYVNERSQAPQDRNNVVVNGLAMNVVLSDTGSGNCDFYAPQTFTAEMITYSREFKQATQVGVCRGWETISLPFMVQTITHADNGVIAPFGVDSSNKHFWLRQLSTNGLVSATKIEANLPYLISMPNDEKNYAKEYILKGLVTFSAENAVVPKTEPTALALADSSIVMMPALQSVGKSSTVWALNVGMERSQYFEGSTFERDYREVRPFEAYTIHRSDTPAPRFLPINDLMNSATGIETISNVIMSHDNYYHLDGRKVDGKPTKKGLYITNGRKVVIK